MHLYHNPSCAFNHNALRHLTSYAHERSLLFVISVSGNGGLGKPTSSFGCKTQQSLSVNILWLYGIKFFTLCTTVVSEAFCPIESNTPGRVRCPISQLVVLDSVAIFEAGAWCGCLALLSGRARPSPAHGTLSSCRARLRAVRQRLSSSTIHCRQDRACRSGPAAPSSVGSTRRSETASAVVRAPGLWVWLSGGYCACAVPGSSRRVVSRRFPCLGSVEWEITLR